MQRFILWILLFPLWALSTSSKKPQLDDAIRILDKSMARVENRRRADFLRNPNKPFKPVAPMGLQVRCIPLMTLGLIADPMSFSTRLIHSIDHCVDNMWVIISRDFEFSHLHSALTSNSNIRNLTVIRSPHPLFSVSEGWNTGLHALRETDAWILICNYDVEFLKGQLRDLSYLFWNHSSVLIDGRPVVEAAFVGYQNLDGCGFNVIALTNALVRRIGYFDENYFPAFYEDNDYMARMILDKTRIRYFRNITPWHGKYSRKNEYKSGVSYLKKV